MTTKTAATIPLTERARKIQPSITLALAARAAAMRKEGRDVINMAVGEPDFPAPPLVQENAVSKVQSGDVRYTPAAGTPELRAAVARHLTDTRGVPFGPDQLVICHSSKHALTQALLATVQEGDEVLCPLPAWSSYFDIVRLAGGEPVLVAPHDKGSVHPDLEGLRRAVTDRTRVLMINSPNNPSGLVLDHDEIAALGEFAVEHGLVLLSDEIYRALVYDNPAPSPVEISAEIAERTLIVDGASKVFAMTGYRIGYLAGPKEVISSVAAMQSQMTGSPNAISQEAFRAALEEEPPETEVMRMAFAERREVILKGLEDVGLSTPRPGGAFYAFPDVSPYLDERGSVGFCEDLLQEHALALVPGSAFGLEEHIRLSYAVSVETIEEALRRLASFLEAKRG